MTNEEFLELLSIYSVNSIIRFDIAEHAKKLVAVAEAAKSTYGATIDEDDGEGDGLYVGWKHYMVLGKALKELQGGEE